MISCPSGGVGKYDISKNICFRPLSPKIKSPPLFVCSLNIHRWSNDNIEITSFPSPKDDLLKPKHYSVNFLSHSIFHFWLHCFSNFLHLVGFFSINKFWRQHPTKQQLYGYLTLITKTIKIKRTRHAGHCWRSRDELICTSVDPFT